MCHIINRIRRRQCANMQNIACLGKIMSIITSSICEAQFMKKLSNTEPELKKYVTLKKASIKYHLP